MQVQPGRPVWNGLIAMALLFVAGCGEGSPPLAASAMPEQMDGAQKARARQLIGVYGCVACHTVPGVRGPQSTVGPPLDGVASRGYLGGVLPNTPDNLVRWLLDPPAIDPRTAMPDVGMTDEDAKAIAAYLLESR